MPDQRRRTFRHTALICVLTVAVTGCASRPLPPPAALPGPPPGVDGRYRGTSRLVRGDRFCPRSGPRVYEVRNGVVTLSYSAGGRSRVPLSADIDSSGSIRANDGVGAIEGQLANGLLEVTIASEQCEHRWTMRKVP